VTIALVAVTWFSGVSLAESQAAPYGLLSFELAGDGFVARTIAETWDEEQRLYVAFLLGLRFLIGLCVTSTLATGCLWQAGEVRRWIRSLAWSGVALAALQIAAGALEALTGVWMIAELIDRSYEESARPILLSAVAKYAFVAAGVAYIAVLVPLNRFRPEPDVLVRPLTAVQ
jgi:hypothetical protein